MIRKNSLFLIAAAIALAASATPADELHVGPGETHTTIQSAIAAAVDGDTVIVADGTWTGDGNRDINFNGKAITVKSENGPETCIIDCQGTEQDRHRGFLFSTDEGRDSILEGITITNATLSSIRCAAASPTIRRCILRDNISMSFGGGLYCTSSQALIENCTITGNEARTGGGVCARYSDITILNTSITSNLATDDGAGVYYYHGSVTIQNSLIAKNSSTDGYSGALYISGCNATITNCTIVGNTCDGRAPALYLSGSSSAIMTNCILWNNSKGLTYVNDSEIVVSSSSSLTLAYSIVEGGQALISVGDSSDLVWGQGNIDADPLLTYDLLHLLPDSPCIDAGDPDFDTSNLATDLDGESRVHGGRVDMGPDEFIDTDADGLADWFEQAASGSATGATPQDNPDSDSFINEQEYLHGANPALGSDYYVDPENGNDEWTGRAADWDGVDGPKRTIQAAIDACQNGQVILKTGVYTGQGNRDLEFKGKPIVVMGDDPLDSDTVAATVINCQGTESEYHRGFDFHHGEDDHSLLTGLTITNGYHATGGAIHCLNSSPTIRHCSIINNECPDTASELNRGGGIYRNAASTGMIADCLISGNSTYRGAGLYNSGPLSLMNCTIEHNVAIGDGGGISHQYGTQFVNNCTIRHNTGRYVSAIYNISGEMFISNTIVANNVSTEPVHFGRAIGRSQVAGTVSVFNSTIAYNIGDGIDGGFYLENTIIWGHAPYIAIRNFSVNSMSAFYCNVEGDWLPNFYRGNISVDPLFVDADAGDYHLDVLSLCINAGDPNYIPEVNETDLDGNPRVAGGRIDMGVYEFQPLSPAELLFDLTDYIDELSLHKGIANSLQSKLDAVLWLLEDGNENNDIAAVNLLEAFINSVEAQRGKKIIETDADALIITAQEIIELLNDG